MQTLVSPIKRFLCYTVLCVRLFFFNPFSVLNSSLRECYY